MSRLAILVLGLMLPVVAVSQAPYPAAPDSAIEGTTQPNLLLLPTWIPPTDFPIDSAPDSLLQPVWPELQKTRPFSRMPLWLGAGLIAAGSTLAYTYHQQAEAAYQEYVTSGDPEELDRLFSRAERFDRQSGWSFVAAEAGLVLISLSVVFGP